MSKPTSQRQPDGSAGGRRRAAGTTCRSGEEAEEEDDLSLSRSGPATVEELDLAPMVDVAFQLVLFFMVTATTVLYKTLEIPKPTTEQAPTAVAQGRSLAIFRTTIILVEIDAAGAVKIDREPVAADMNTWSSGCERLARRPTARRCCSRPTIATKHRDTVLAIDAANEIGMDIVIAQSIESAGTGAQSVVAAQGGGSTGRTGRTHRPAALRFH